MKKITFALISAAVLGTAIFIVPGGRSARHVPESAKVAASSTAERLDYFASHGWEVEEIAGRDVTIPGDFSAVYEEYADIQDRQGLPLREYAGRNARLYMYEVKNYSPGSRKMLAELLVCDDTAVASMVYSEDGGSLRLAVS
ncbi:MAG: DUF4830 domain-containing protein [Ruminococcus sp.]|nr:DUF4830 domain-containing protein [Ruminococcus sp.]